MKPGPLQMSPQFRTQAKIPIKILFNAYEVNKITKTLTVQPLISSIFIKFVLQWFHTCI